MIHLQKKTYVTAYKKMQIAGGRSQNVAGKLEKMQGRLSMGEKAPFHGFNVTNHGESRIKHCVKYDLGDGYRLVTVQNDNYICLCFAGNHEKTDEWINRNRGLEISVNDSNEFTEIRKTIDLEDADSRIIGDSDGTGYKLVERLKGKYQDRLLSNISPSILLKISVLYTGSEDKTIFEIASAIDDYKHSTLVYDVLILLREGDLEKAKYRIDEYYGEIKSLEDLKEEELLEVKDGETIKRIPVNSEEYKKWIGEFSRVSNYQDWMLFMHPRQQEIVDAELKGAAKLSGVSGSGKTCIVVNRAIRLAKMKPELPVLILTLNKSLAALIKSLVDYACPDESVKEKVVVQSFFELCQDYLNEFEPENKKLYDDITWKNDEHIDEVWREYFRCHNNNNDAEVMLPISFSLNSQKIFPEDYVRQEFDWIRSAFCLDSREKYLLVERKGRAVPLQKEWRKKLLSGLGGWEDIMIQVGVTDYLGLATSLFNNIDKIGPAYSSVLVDEAQDFGTIELKIIRKLVRENTNDILLCGDMAQHVLPKHQSFKDAGINIPSSRTFTVLKNYRNSREILQAAYDVLIRNLAGDVLMDSELEVLDPEYANFSTHKPPILKADSLEEEFSYALSHLKERIDNEGQNFKGCIAFAGFTLLEVTNFAKKAKLPVLDGSKGLFESQIFVSDLEQTKGYEFDSVCILHCEPYILPPLEMPQDEQFRDACRLYVAMTRAKRELIMSWSGALSPWLEVSVEYFERDFWSAYVDMDEQNKVGSPIKIPDLLDDDQEVYDLDGRSFLYTKHAIGLSLELQNKIFELIDGKGAIRAGSPVRWKNMKLAYKDVEMRTVPKQLFGPKTYKEFLGKVEELLPYIN